LHHLYSTTFNPISATPMGFLIKKPDDVPGSALPATLVGLFVAFGGVLFGFVPIFPPAL